MAPQELPAGVFRAGNPPVVADRKLTLVGNGVRLGALVERRLGRRVGLSIGLAADAIRFGSATYDGADWSLRSSGWGLYPRAQLGATFRPFR